MYSKKAVSLKEIHKFGQEVLKELNYEIRRLSHFLGYVKKKQKQLEQLFKKK